MRRPGLPRWKDAKDHYYHKNQVEKHDIPFTTHPTTQQGLWAPRKAHPHTFPDSFLDDSEMNPRHDALLHIHSHRPSVPFSLLLCAGVWHVHVCLCIKEKSQKVRLIKENLYTVKFTFFMQFWVWQTTAVHQNSQDNMLIISPNYLLRTCHQPPPCSSLLPVTCLFSALIVSAFPECKVDGTAPSILRVWLLLLANVSGIDPCCPYQ